MILNLSLAKTLNKEELKLRRLTIVDSLKPRAEEEDEEEWRKRREVKLYIKNPRRVFFLFVNGPMSDDPFSY